MKRRLFVCVLLIISFKLFSQDLLFEQDITLKSVFKDKRESLPVVNDKKNEILLFLLDNKEINSLLFNRDYELIDNYSTDRPDGKFKILLGHSADSINYHLFFTNNRKNQIYVKSINLVDKKSEGKLLSLTLKDEIFLERISYKNKFYMLTIKNMSSIMNLYEFNGNTITNTVPFYFSSYRFSNKVNSKLFNVLCEVGSFFQVKLKVHKVDNSNPNPLDITSKENKLYCYNDKIYITLDNDEENTKMITIDLTNYSSRVNYISQVNLDGSKATRVKSNSYLFEDNLFQIKGSKKELCFQIKDINTDSLRKEYRVKEDEEIKFRNSPLRQEGGLSIFTQDSERELTKTKQVLRKISASEIGVAVDQSGENLELIVGGVKEVQGSTYCGVNGTMIVSGSSISTPHGVITPSVTYHYNPTMYAYNTYKNTRSVYFKSLLDHNDFNHIERTVGASVYDKIKDFEKEDNNLDISSQTIFKYDGYYVFGYYKKWEEKYYLRKFTR